jgi:hypothetical protein
MPAMPIGSKWTLGRPLLKSEDDMAAHIALEEIDFIWEESQVHLVRNYWKEGKVLIDIAAEIKRKPIEVFLLLLDQAERGIIKGPVQNGFYFDERKKRGKTKG